MLVQTILVTDDDGRESVLIFHYEAGKETTNHAGPGTVRSRASWVARELVIESWMNAKDRELHFKDHWSLSDDDDTLTMAHRDGDLAGQVSVLDRASALAAARFESWKQ